MRVVQVIGNAIVGGMENFAARLCDHLLRSGHFVVASLCPYESAATDVLRDLGCVVQVAPLPEEPVWRGIEYASSPVAEEAIDVLHAHLVSRATYDQALGGGGRRDRVTCIANEVDAKPSWKLRRPACRWSRRRWAARPRSSRWARAACW